MSIFYSVFLSAFFVVLFALPASQAAVLPVEPIESSKQIDRMEQRRTIKIKKLTNRLAKAKSQKRKMRLQRRIDQLQEGSAVGLAAVLGAIAGIALGGYAIFTALTGNPIGLFLPMLGILLGLAAIIFGFVDMRYAESLGLSWGAVVLGIIAAVVCVVAIILL